MANSELRAALRTLYREKSYALINLLGLSLAIACFMILGLYLRSELTYDLHHIRHKEIFRVVSEIIHGGSPETYAVSSLAMGPLLKRDFPEVKDFVRFTPAGGPKSAESQKLLIRAGDKAIYWNRIFFADANVFDIFTHKIIYGDPKTALKDPASAAVSETFARRYFGNANPIGRTIQADLTPQIPREITLVFRDLPENTRLKYDALFH
jgi:putative ABC transport system permease protein